MAKTPAVRGQNVLAYDPTRTTTLRREFMAEFQRRFNLLARQIYDLVVTEDAFGLKRSPTPEWAKEIPAGEALYQNERWKFQTSFQKTGAFGNWLKAKYAETILQENMQAVEDKYWKAYLMDGFKKGAGKSYADVMKKGLKTSETDKAFYQGGQAQFLKDAFAQPETIEKAKLLASRVYSNLEGVTQNMATQMNRILTDGLIQGMHPNEIAKRLSAEVGIAAKRAKTIARTEIIYAHAEGQLLALEKLGVAEVGVNVEWSTAGDGHVCPKCSPMGGTVFKIKDAHGLIPRHPNCRCSFVPAFVGESDKDQLKTKEKVEGAIRKSIKAELGKKAEKMTPAQQKAASKWAGADVNVTPLKPPIVKPINKPTFKTGDYGPLPPISKPLPKPQLNPLKPTLKKPATPKKLPPIEPVAPVPAPKPPAAVPPVSPPIPKVVTPKPAPKPPAPKPQPIPVEPKVSAFTPDGFPTRESITVQSTLPGSTGPKLVVDAKGKKWVMKEGLNPEHVQSEALADKLYRTLGLDVPESGIVFKDGKPIKFSTFLEGGDPLGKWMKTAKPEELKKVLAKIQDGFAADALLGNWDVAGLSMDNILVKAGIPYRIDNGGALLFRAQGAKKANWGTEVKELKTLLDPATNAQTAQLFSGITPEQIRAQIDDLMGVKDKLLAEIPDASLRQLISDRLDWMNENVKTAARFAPADDFVKKVKESRVNGRRLLSDKGDIEDVGLLVWEEIDETGEVVTRISGKLTVEGGAKVQAALGDSMPTMGGKVMVDSTSSPSDFYWDDMLAALKTVNAHVGDGAYNVAKIDKVKSLLKNITSIIDLPAYQKDASLLAMLKHYQKMGLDIIDSVDLKKATAQYEKYVVPKVAPKPAEPGADRGRLRVTRQATKLKQSKFEKGRAIRQSTATTVSGENIEIDLDDATVQYFVPSLASGHRSGRALENTVNITIRGPVSKQTIESGQKALERLGIDPTPDPDHEELAYLVKGVKLMKLDKLKEYTDIVLSAGKTSKQKVDQVKDWLKKTQSIDVDKIPSYNPKGVASTFAGDGHHYWNRWDLTPEQVKKEMKDYHLFHRVGGSNIAQVLDNMLESGGQATSTIQRLRKGVPISEGMSAQTDITTGGADYFFTRIYKNTERSTGLRFKIDRLARMDAVSYDSDYYGSMDKLDRRETTIAGFKENARGGSNETIFKNGLSILDDLETVVVSSEDARAKVLDVFAKHKILTLPDGRSIHDLVKTEAQLRK